MTDFPEWVKQRTCDLANENCGGFDHWKPADVGPYSALTALAKHVMEYEEPPVDPLLTEARKICAKVFAAGYKTEMNYHAGEYDRLPPIRAAHAALKRGIEMAGEA